MTDGTFLPLVSGINSRLLSVDHALISPILFHPVLRVALLPLVSHIDSPLSSSITPHSFIPGLKHSFSTNPSHRSLPFLLQH